jgi:hypothetical protein
MLPPTTACSPSLSLLHSRAKTSYNVLNDARSYALQNSTPSITKPLPANRHRTPHKLLLHTRLLLACTSSYLLKKHSRLPHTSSQQATTALCCTNPSC